MIDDEDGYKPQYWNEYVLAEWPNDCHATALVHNIKHLNITNYNLENVLKFLINYRVRRLGVSMSPSDDGMALGACYRYLNEKLGVEIPAFNILCAMDTTNLNKMFNLDFKGPLVAEHLNIMSDSNIQRIYDHTLDSLYEDIYASHKFISETTKMEWYTNDTTKTLFNTMFNFDYSKLAILKELDSHEMIYAHALQEFETYESLISRIFYNNENALKFIITAVADMCADDQKIKQIAQKLIRTLVPNQSTSIESLVEIGASASQIWGSCFSENKVNMPFTEKMEF